MSIARHHNEWLSLVEVSGPFLSMPVLMRVFPQGLEALDRDMLAELRLAYNEWLDDQNSLRPTPAIHTVWVRYVLERLLGFESAIQGGAANLLEGPAIPANLKTFVAEQGETLSPDLVIADSPLLPGEGPGVRSGARVLIQIHPISQGLEKSMQGRRWKVSPAMRMLELLRATGVQLGLVTNGEQWMLVNAPRGETSAFVSWYAALWLEEPLTLRAFRSLLSASRFFSVAEEDTLEGMLKASANEQQEVTDQLGYQVRQAVEVLIRAVDKADQDRGRTLLKNISETELYEAALTVMMRLVFLFSAEERGLLLLGDPLYDQNYAVSTLRAQLRETADQQGEEVLGRRFDAWCRLLAAFRAVHGGIHHDRLNLPAYGGSLFDPDRYPFLEGRSPLPASEALGEGSGVRAEPLPISNRTVLHLLEALQILRVKTPGGGPAEARRLSFRALDVEQIGHVYEGLLDHIAVRAGEIVLGLSGTRGKEPEIPISTLQAEEARGEKSFLAYLREQTGRTENALRKVWLAEPDAFASQHLLVACNNDPKISAQVEKYAGLLREDDFGYPAVFLPGSVYITAGATRRATGTHYTPRSLTEPIVQHTLEPLVYIGPAEGLPKEQWKLRSSAELLELKICDMAMGSAGFLVQVIRYLSERLVEAWEALTPGPPLPPLRLQGEGRFLQITPEGKPASGAPGETIIPKDDEERLVLARRLVADRCIYGVDKNPLAVEIAKLSIWLTTMDKGRPFTFLDHALKCGDSLVGAGKQDFLNWARLDQRPVGALMDADLKEWLETALQKRKALEAFTVCEVRDAEQKAALLAEAEQAMIKVKRGADLWVGAHLMALNASERQTLLLRLVTLYLNGVLDGEIDAAKYPDAARALNAACQVSAFHWEFEFPEVFERGGFNSFVGNPPFMWGMRISTYFGLYYFNFLVEQVNQSVGAADYCVYFLRNSAKYCRKQGCIGLITVDTIAQGDTREVGLDTLVKKDIAIYRAISSQFWPGSASVKISRIHLFNGKWNGQFILNDAFVQNINPFLRTEKEDKPFALAENSGKSFVGHYLMGQGFVLNTEDEKELLALEPNASQVIFDYLRGEDINQRPDQKTQGKVINFGTLSLDECRIKYPKTLARIERLIKPERDKQKRKANREKWWQYAEVRPGLTRLLQNRTDVLVQPFTTKYIAHCFVSARQVFASPLVVIDAENPIIYPVLQSNFHDAWVRKYASKMGDRVRYASSDCFENFPFPTFFNEDDKYFRLQKIGNEYHQFRKQLLFLLQEGITDLYNRFHNKEEKASDIVRLRELRVEMDNAVAAAYGWSDIDLGHGFHETPQGVRYTISDEARREVLARLLRLNHERYEEEVRLGLHERKGKGSKGKKGKTGKEKPGQIGMF